MFKRIAILGMAVFAWCAQAAIAAPVVTLTGPATNSKYLPPAAITVTADASDSDAGIARVDFYANGLLIGTDASAPYAIDWADVPAGSYNLTAKATSHQNLSKISAAVKVIVNTAPVISLTAPTPDSSMAGLADIVIAVDVSDADNNLAKVTFHNGWNIIGTVTAAPYTMTWNDVPPGTYTISARATDSLNEMVSTGSAKVTVVNPLSVHIVSPAPNAKFLPTDTIALTADANTSNGNSNSSISQVAFYHGTTLIGSATSAPYTYQWTHAQAGSYNVTAKVTDSQGLVKTSTPVKITVNTPPVISLTSPAPDSSMAGPADIVIAADVSDADNNLAKVTFHNGWNIIGTVTAAPYTMTWNDVPPGTYTISARATDSLNEMVSTGSAKVTVTVNANAAPTVSLTAPVPDQHFTAPAAIVLHAEANDTDGSIAKVDFYQGSTLIGSVSDAPYSYLWSEVAAGDYSITAKATDNGGSVTTSSPVSITVAANQAPTVSVTATPGTATAPASITISAEAADSDGAVARVEFFEGSTLIGTDTAAPYRIDWTNVAAGEYSITARATDQAGAGTVSAPVTVTVAGSSSQVYYIEADHLNTPRIVTDSSNHIVWQWDNSDPFGNNVPQASNGFELNLRFPGQYFDTETNLHYNYFRDYDPATGRYVQSDPIGLGGGINTFTYVENEPLTGADEDGLQRRSNANPRTPGSYGGRQGSWTGGRFYPSLGPTNNFPYPIRYSTTTSNQCGVCFDIYFVAQPQGTSRGSHRRGANEQFFKYLTGVGNGQVGGVSATQMRQHMQGGSSGLRNPEGFQWHHPVNRPNEIWLMRRCDHRSPDLQPYLHPLPGGGGGYSQNF